MMNLNVLVADASRFSLQIVQNPDKAYGGEKFGQQPVLQVVDEVGNLRNNFVGSVIVKMGTSPTGFEPLYYLDDNSVGCYATGDDKCGVEVTGLEAEFEVVQGIATFSVLIDFHSKLTSLYQSSLVFRVSVTSVFDSHRIC